MSLVLFVTDGKVVLHEYEASPSGLVKSFVDRFKDNKLDNVLIQMAEDDAEHFVIDH